MNKNGPSYFDNYLCKINHNYDNRGNNSPLVIPKMKSESGRSFRIQGALVFNKLPKGVPDQNSFILFKKIILRSIWSFNFI